METSELYKVDKDKLVFKECKVYKVYKQSDDKTYMVRICPNCGSVKTLRLINWLSFACGNCGCSWNKLDKPEIEDVICENFEPSMIKEMVNNQIKLREKYNDC